MPIGLIKKHLIPFWISFPRDVNFPIGFGVTAFSIDDAYSILEEYNLDHHRRAIELNILEHAKWEDIAHLYRAELIANHVVPNVGPMVVRGVWFPNFNSSGI